MGPVNASFRQAPGAVVSPAREPLLRGPCLTASAFSSSSASSPDSGSCGPDMCPWGPCTQGLRLDPLSGLVQRGLGWRRGVRWARLFLTRRQEGGPPTCLDAPFHPGLRTKPSPQSVSHKLEKGVARRRRSAAAAGPPASPRAQSLPASALPRTVLRGRPQHSASFPGVAAQGHQSHTGCKPCDDSAVSTSEKCWLLLAQ